MAIKTSEKKLNEEQIEEVKYKSIYKDRYLLDKFYELNFGIYFDEVEDLQWAKVYTSNLIKEEYNNHADVYSLEGNLEEKIAVIEKILLGKKRKPAIYISDFSLPKVIGDNLRKFRFIKSFEDAWMVLENSYILPVWEDMKGVVHIGNDPKLIDAFERISTISYKGERTPDNPYGGIPMQGYINAAKKDLQNSSTSNRMEGYLLQYKGEFVSCALLLHDQEAGYIANVATVPEYRKRGFGKMISNYAAKRSKHLGLKTTFLATERNSSNEDFYSRIGYKTKFTGICYIKDLK